MRVAGWSQAAAAGFALTVMVGLLALAVNPRVARVVEPDPSRASASIATPGASSVPGASGSPGGDAQLPTARGAPDPVQALAQLPVLRDVLAGGARSLRGRLRQVLHPVTRNQRLSLASIDQYRAAKAMRTTGSARPGAPQQAPRLRTALRAAFLDVLDLERTATALPLLRPGASVTGVDRSFLDGISHLELLDCVGEATLGAPVFGFARAFGTEPTVSTTPPALTGAEHPVQALLDPMLRSWRLFPVLPVLNECPRGFMVEQEDFLVDRIVGRLQTHEHNNRLAFEGTWPALGKVPSSLAPARGLRVHVRVAGLPPDSCLFLRFGPMRFAVRGQMRHFTDFMHVTPQSREKAAAAATSYLLEIPPGWLRDSDRALALRLDSISGGNASFVRLCWLVDLELAPGP